MTEIGKQTLPNPIRGCIEIEEPCGQASKEVCASLGGVAVNLLSADAVSPENTAWLRAVWARERASRVSSARAGTSRPKRASNTGLRIHAS